jgi:hypothetical protein
MRRKARGMEKVENLYCTARAQHVMPRRSNHVAGSGGADRFKPSRESSGARSWHDRERVGIAAGHLDVESTLAARRLGHAIRRCVVKRCNAGRPPAAAMQDNGPGAVSRSRHRVPVGASAGCPLPDMSQFVAELCENCADIAPIVPSLARRSPKFDRYPAKLLAMQRAAP